ncbi:hypothetical protein [Schinkia azotoformans]|uniref:hypothetical protein n=1 Tax=Schinkia azotoformans TaxID=1454 RepID=UPI002DBE896E|nr:hypothetical protein [Schinkia azotoformans]MEC1714774.1 hypothetical protein [Schinkia azotoformans]MEC1757470.1 hypothetical protein [Schinkia azotoformans]
MSKKRIDITGGRYGRLLVVKEVEPKGYKRRYLCKCDCGKEKTVYMNNLQRGLTLSCGCLQKKKSKEASLIDISGNRYGRLVVIEQAPTKNERTFWLCKCDCGNTIPVNADRLVNGHTKSCGCYRIEKGHDLKQHQENNFRIDDVLVPMLKRKIGKNNKTGVKGVYIHNTNKGIKYRAMITINKKQIHLGLFDTIEEAAAVRKQAENEYHEPYIKALEEKD